MTDLLLPTALLWFDDSDKSLEEKVKQAAARYRYKHGKPPTLCFVHPDALGDSGEARQVGGVEVRAGRAVLRDHFWIGRTASAEQEQLEELREHVAAEKWQEADYDAHRRDRDAPQEAADECVL